MKTPPEPLPWQTQVSKINQKEGDGKILAASLPSVSWTTAGGILARARRKSEKDPSARGGTGALNHWEPGDKHIKITFKMGERKKERKF